jgi:hypothetical protein
MNLRIIAAAPLLSALATSLYAADPQLLKLVMPDVKVISDVNVAQAKLSSFGQYVLSQAQSGGLSEFTTLTGFDPSRDLTEFLCASNGTQNTGLALATGIFDPVKIGALISQQGAVTETYQGTAILEDPKKVNGVAFLNSGLVAAGDIANVKAAIARQSSPTTLSKDLMNQITTLSNSDDAWVISTVSPASLAPSAASNKPETVGGVTLPGNVLQQVQSGYAGVKFGANITVTAQATTIDAQTATNLAGVMQFLQNMALAQASQSPDAAAFARSISITATGTTVNFSASLPEDQFQKMFVQTQGKPHPAVHKK